MVPKAIKDVFHDWASEVMNQGVHVHSKVIVIDPFGKHPVVITGSHNLGYKASTKNDDNMMIVEGNAPLAASYAANIIAIYQTYRWNTYVDAHAKDPQVWHGLVDNATWQDSYLKADGPDLAEIKFWLGEGASAPAARPPVAAPASGGAASSGCDRKRTIAARKQAWLDLAPPRNGRRREGNPVGARSGQADGERRRKNGAALKGRREDEARSAKKDPQRRGARLRKRRPQKPE